MREEIATTKWCPFVKAGSAEDEQAVAFNRLYSQSSPPSVKQIPPITLCVGSACMAWRFADHNYDDGYCGLAGKLIAR